MVLMRPCWYRWSLLALETMSTSVANPAASDDGDAPGLCYCWGPCYCPLPIQSMLISVIHAAVRDHVRVHLLWYNQRYVDVYHARNQFGIQDLCWDHADIHGGYYGVHTPGCCWRPCCSAWSFQPMQTMIVLLSALIIKEAFLAVV